MSQEVGKCGSRAAGVEEEILETALASLTDADIPPPDDEVDRWPDPTSTARPRQPGSMARSWRTGRRASVPPTPAWPLSFQAPTGPESWRPDSGARQIRDGPGFADGGY